MKHLILTRHAKTEVIHDAISDYERNLTKRGIQDSNLISNYLLEKGIVADLLISSPANRAIATAKLFANRFNITQNNILKLDQLYNSLSTQEFLELLQHNAGHHDRVWVFGHNPDIASWAFKLLDENYRHVPTGTAIGIEFDVNNWSDIDARSGKLSFYVYPKMLKE